MPFASPPHRTRPLPGLLLLPLLSLACVAAPATRRASVESGAFARDAGARGVPQDAEPKAGSGAHDLSSQATDPTASLMSLNVIGTYTGAYTDDPAGLDDDAFELSFRPVIPFQAWGRANILRLTIPYQLDGRGEEGLGDVAVFDLVMFPESWGRWGIGPVMNLSAQDGAADEFAIGPAVGGVAKVSDDLNIGLFSQNLFAGDTAISQLQPVVAWQLGSGWALSAGDLQFVYDWEDSRWLSVPLGFQLGVVLPLVQQPMRFSVNPQYNLVDDDGLPEWSLAFTVTLLAPSR
jgi:hypothetical protein